jgi:hypothetical protein
MAELNITTPTKTSKPKVMVKITNSAGSTGSGKKASASKQDGKASPSVLEFNDL